MNGPTKNTLAIAEVIERYLHNHPRAADTSDGIRSWWITRERAGDSPGEVQIALDYLVDGCRLSRSVLTDGTVVYSAAMKP
jgi:hypothetical protein